MSSVTAQPPASAAVLANPKAGGTTPDLVEAVAELCRGHGLATEVSWTQRPGGAAQLAARTLADPPDLVIAIGGDGTVREVAGVLATARGAARGPAAEAGPALFAVPGGTGNSGYRMLWGERAWDDALRAVLRGEGVRLRGIDLGRLADSGVLVLLGASVGLFAEALIEARNVPKRGWERYTEALLTTAARLRPFPVAAHVDGAVVFKGETVLPNVGGGRFRAGQYRLLPESMFDDGLLDLAVFGAAIPAADVLERTRGAGSLRGSDVVYARGRHIRIERLDGFPLCYEYDGEVQPRGASSLSVEVVAHALPMWAPNGEGLSA